MKYDKIVLKKGDSMNQTLCKVLIVDDEYIIRQGIEYILDWEKEGFRIVGEAGNGEEALAKIAEFQPDIVLSDIVMPKMDGIDLTKAIQQHYPNCKVIILSSYSDFEYVKNTFQNGAVDYILKPTLNPQELLAVLKKAAASIPSLTMQASRAVHISTQLSQMLLGFAQSIDIEALEKDFPGQYRYLLISNQRFISDSALLIRFFEQDMYTEKNRLHPCMIQLPNNNIIALISTDERREELKALLLTLIKNSPILLKEGFFVLSDAFHDLKDIKLVYDTTVESLRSRFYFQHIPFYEDITLIESKKFDQRQYSKHLDMMQLNNALDMLMEYINEVVEKHSISEGELKSFTGNALYMMISVLEEHDLNAESVRHFKLNCINLLESAVFASVFMEQLHAICDDFKIIFKNYELDQNSNQLMQYLYEHYAEPITLQYLADRFGFSYHYLSTYFSTQSKETFIECLNRIRIEKACALLNEPGAVISEIGMSVGYSDHSYFCKVFKKLTGMTPSEYKKR